MFHQVMRRNDAIFSYATWRARMNRCNLGNSGIICRQVSKLNGLATMAFNPTRNAEFFAPKLSRWFMNTRCSSDIMLASKRAGAKSPFRFGFVS